MGVLDREWFHRDDNPSGDSQPQVGQSSGMRQSGSGRVPQWALEEALNEQLRAYRTEAGGRWPGDNRAGSNRAGGLRGGGNPAGGGRRRRRRERSSVRKLRVRTAALVVFVVALYLTPTVFERDIFPDVLPLLPWSNVPPRGVEASTVPLGTPPPSTGSAQYALFDYPNLQQEFVAYDPCRPIHYVVRPDNAPAGTEGIVQEAVAEVSAATGLTFVFDGPTSEPPSPGERDSYQPDRYGKRWAPVLITWTSPSEIPELAGDTAGLGGSEIAQRPDKPLVLVAGQVMLDAPAMVQILEFDGGREHVRAIVIHELAHVLGLDHVQDPTQLMYEQNTGQIHLAEGDLAGLAKLGAGPCVPEL